MNDPVNQSGEQKLREAAAEWRVRVGSGEVSEADWAALEAWLSQSPEHRAAFAKADELWRALDRHAGDIRAHLKAADERRGAGPLRRRPRLVSYAFAAAAALVIAVLAHFYWPFGAASTYTTAKGQMRDIELADGTKVALNTDSRISVRFTRGERRVAMGDAEALFDVAKDPARPFIISAGDRQIRVIGTKFDVLHHAGELKVSVLRGIVAVVPPGGAQTVRLEVGQQLIHRESTGQTSVKNVDPAQAASWRDGRLIFDGEPLDRVASDLNRYFETPLSVSEGARSIRFTGVLVLDSEDQVVARLQSFLPVIAERSGGKILLRPRDSAAQ